MLRKLLIFFALAIFLVPSGVALAETKPLAPEFNPICWKEKDCIKIRAELLREESQSLSAEDNKKLGEGGFVANEPPCTGGDKDNRWGKCLPAGVAITEIAFGGNKTFLHIGDFIKKNYNFAIGVAGVLAAIMVVMAGFQWATSGGNAETISKAKKRITGAVIGLVIAYTSYVILSTINPDLVNLRLPQAYILRPQNEMPKMCSEAPVSSLFAPVADKDHQETKIDTSKSYNFDITWMQITNREQEPNCGARYLANNGGANTCFGDVCPQGQICLNFNIENLDDKTYKCQTGSIYGEVVGNYLINTMCYAAYEFPWVEESVNGNKSRLVKFCYDKTKSSVLNKEIVSTAVKVKSDSKSQTSYFKFNSIPDANENCSRGEFWGYGIYLDLNGNCVGPRTYDILIGKNGKEILPTQIIGKEDLFTAYDVINGYRLFIDVSTFKDDRY